jgi:hypothetical protein
LLYSAGRANSKAVYDGSITDYIPNVSATAQSLLEQIRKLPVPDQQEILQQLPQVPQQASHTKDPLFPTVRLKGGVITSEQVAEAVDDE